ncbi:xanthine dehydrogenase small subunit [Bauldia sp.]|uniref:xanthine dehydrogenase small subunit n=1 Tax=Bauldia sp. TaxID=2575872 RepID=UPI003BAA17E0
MRDAIRFVRNGRIVERRDFAPTDLLLDYLRETEGATGTKEGCGEGDCGACTVAVGRLRGNRLVYEPVNACIQLLGQVDGCEIVAVDDLADENGDLHPVQASMHDHHGSQCGFCTPGFIMSLFALYHSTEERVDRSTVNDWLAGNLCRCTGYRPIVDAALAACGDRRSDRYAANASDTAGLLSFLLDEDDIFVGDSDRFFAAPATIDNLADLYESHPDATIVAGATDVGLWITKQFRDLPKVIHVGRTKGFDEITETDYDLTIGAGATYAAAEPYFRALDPDLGELLRRLGSKQVRAAGTIGGNVANGSPIGDTPPALIALDATLELRRGRDTRRMPIEDFFIDYGKQDRQPGELVVSLHMPKMNASHIFRCYKISKRFDQDISAVMGAFRFTVSDDGQITEARIAYGGMAAIPKRARNAEAALTDTMLRDSRAWSRAFAALREDFDPIGDHRASARYRNETAHALLGKALIEAAGTTSARTRVIGHRVVVA